MSKGRGKFFDSVRVSGLIREAGGSDDAAKQLLLIAAEYIRDGEPLPYGLDDYIAGAIETAVNNPAKCDPYNADIGAALLIGLNLKRTSRPTKGVDPFAVCALMFDEMCFVEGEPETIVLTMSDGTEVVLSPSSQSEAARRAADVFDISESTAKRYFREHIDKYLERSSAEPPTEEDMHWLAKMQEREAK